ncbi:Stealth-like protein [Arthrobacter sp. AG1021]|uniref:Stealth CR1 domain-containing protein n=1 Tax=Arthrobacter sp. AG1021 TaxID=2183908 RepID=UPI000F1EEA53|nr:Stealth CR1 domain-containing protein [Arthrobacter sp. AG1021]RKS19544.1 Stealth-like protein [Arthrobacter sp. AG1021]
MRSNAMKVKDIAKSAIGEEKYLRIRPYLISCKKVIESGNGYLGTLSKNRKVSVKSSQQKKTAGIIWNHTAGMMPEQAYIRNFKIVASALDKAGISWWIINGIHRGRRVIGVDANDRIDTLKALSLLYWDFDESTYLLDVDRSKLQISVSRIASTTALKTSSVLRVCSPMSSPENEQKFGFAYGCDIEFWNFENLVDKTRITAPRENQAAATMSEDEFSLVDFVKDGIETKRPSVFGQRMLDDVTFPIDVVYTWVDGDDPSWLEKRAREQSKMDGVEYHPEAIHSARFTSRDELKYSLRSLQAYAPWVNHIYLVTDGQKPDWLDEVDNLTVVDHREIFDNEDIPSFNSNAIISRLHHIKNLSEHYIFMNDDVMFGQQVSPSDFFTPSGIALVSTSNNRRPFGKPSVHDEPHINLTRNIRNLIDQEFGITVSRAIKHTPHPQIKSVHFEMEKKFLKSYRHTWSSKFRHHEDIVADQLHHYYAQIIGKAVPGSLTYNYINILDNRYSVTMRETLKKRHRQAMCINDAPVEGAEPIPESEVLQFLNAYFPIASIYEKVSGDF